ncbi:MAG: ATP-binding protein [Devosiaceae bacterium]|nr:ATP-binding protein [Devosiaceae bacterium]
METRQKKPKNFWRSFVWFVLAAFVSLGAAVLLFIAASSYFGNVEHQRAQNRASLYHNTLIGALERFEHLPFILARDPNVISGASGQNLDQLNRRLADFASSARLDAIYLMDTSGLTISASNYDSETTFLAHNYGFRPYFIDALAGRRGEFFGIGATTAKPGFFIAEQVIGMDGSVLGVIALKLDLSGLTQAWKEGGETVFVSNADGVVVLSSDESWRYQSLFPISESRREAIALERQFAGEPLLPLEWSQYAPDRAELNGKNYIYAAAQVLPLGWTLHFLADERRIQERAWFVLIGAVILALGVLIFAVYLRGERIRAALPDSQADRRLLRAANISLALEIEERRTAEKKLEAAQLELARSSKLAALGQLSASVTHELGQPISAMQNYLAAAQFDANSTERQTTLQRLGGIARRMVSITEQLRFFARPGQSKMEKVDMIAVWDGAIRLVKPDLEQAEIELEENFNRQPVYVFGNRLRLEQVLINLLKNSISALEGVTTKNLKILLSEDHGAAKMSVADNGHGLGDQTMDQLKEPFQTSKESGQGMGLGLAISAAIVAEHGGQLLAQNNEMGGATFTLKLPLFASGGDVND